MSSPRSYLYRLTRNIVIDQLRKARVYGNRAAWIEAEAANPAIPAEIAEADELEEVAARAIDGLAERRREVCVLARLHDLSYRQIFEVLGIAPRTVANHMTLAPSMLARLLAD